MHGSAIPLSAGWMLMGHGRRRRRPPFGFRGGAAPLGFGPGRRAGRGDIRAAILALLSEQPMHGYQIIRELAERSDGLWRASPGSVYPTLQQLQDEGLVRSHEADGKRVFELTDEGRAEVERLPSRAPWEEAAVGADAGLVDLQDVALQLMGATRQVAHAGTTRQIEAASEILRDARRRIYRLLAEDEDDGDASASPES